MFKKVLIANRGAIALRIIRTLKRMGIASVSVYSESDKLSPHRFQSDESYSLGSGPASETYLNQSLIVNIALESGAEAIIPGYGFLSENAEFVSVCETNGIHFIGPTSEQINRFGLKHEARDLAESAGLPLLSGSKVLSSVSEALDTAEQVGYPVMLKSAAGGGGIGMQVCSNAEALSQAFDSVSHLAKANFNDASVFIEKFVQRARHIEIQIAGDGFGDVIAFGDRDCSSQRRNQKVLEEAPAPNLSEDVRVAMANDACRLAQQLSYRNVGTVEFIFDDVSQSYWFLEMNTRLQVEHGVTEEIFNIDLVQLMLEIAANKKDVLSPYRALSPQGHSIQARIYAEDPGADFQPSTGLISHAAFSKDCRLETWVDSGTEISAFYDPMIAKIITYADTRSAALAKLESAMQRSTVEGLVTNMDYIRSILRTKEFVDGSMTTRFLNEIPYFERSIRVLRGGTQTSVQDFPGRQGYWHVGIPPSGPFDSYGHRVANRLVGNSESAPALEITLEGPRLKFTDHYRVALVTPFEAKALLNDEPFELGVAVDVKAGDILDIGKLSDGARASLAISGGIKVTPYLGSCSTFNLGQFGGHAGRALRVGDVLTVAMESGSKPILSDTGKESWYGSVMQDEFIPLRVLYGPHGAPEFFDPADIADLFETQYEVHYNSSRTGIRLIGPKPRWARESGGEAGMHPSNIHDNPYAIGAVDFTGDMPVILGPDGPSLGGFVCPITVISADLWKLGQLKAGSKVRFVAVSRSEASMASEALRHATETLTPLEEPSPIQAFDWRNCLAQRTEILRQIDASEKRPRLCYRSQGDTHLLIEFGQLELDLKLRFYVHAYMLWLEQNIIKGIIDITPGIRSLQIQFDPNELVLDQLLLSLQGAEADLDDADQLSVPSRIVHLPLSWNDAACQEAVDRYMQSVREDAPWCPDNIEFIRRINGLADAEAVKQIVFEANYLVMGLGDVYLGAPVATPINPKHRLVTTKYNPARTWTAENSVGIGGSYLCVYGMEGPGGYQFVGRTIQMWNRFHETSVFSRPWLLRFFDQIRFYEVAASDLSEMRDLFPLDHATIQIEETTLRLSDLEEVEQSDAQAIDDFKRMRSEAFDEELARWRETGQFHFEALVPEVASNEVVIPENHVAVESPVSGNVWSVMVDDNHWVESGTPILLIESMKMEIPVLASCSGYLALYQASPGTAVSPGQVIASILPNESPDE